MSCLINKLKVLKESSKEAVETLDNPSRLKKYMHVEREIEKELLNLVKEVNVLDGPQLILVCGGVGDGKSHIISHLKNEHKLIFDKFSFHNDATESSGPFKTAMETLNDKFLPFSDLNIDNNSNKKLIVAINLGTLNNFLNSEFKNKYTRLKKYIEKKEIFEIKNHENKFEATSNYHYVNFSDYSLYTLNEKKATSDYLSSLLDKIFSESNENIFYSKYKSVCKACDISGSCPVEYNYKSLLNHNNKEILVNILVEIMIKFRQIISTRSILNFFYEIIVWNKIDSFNMSKRIEKIRNLKKKDRIEALWLMILFENKSNSEIFYKISLIDPISKRNEEIDKEIIKLSTTKDLLKYIRQDNSFNKSSYIQQNLEGSQGSNSTFIKYLIRDKYLMKYKDLLYEKYHRYLYALNSNQINQDYKEIYTEMKKWIFLWNGGNSDAEKIRVFPGRKTLKYTITKEFKLDFNITKKEVIQGELKKFIPYLILNFKTDKGVQIDLEIDYFLYKLLYRLSEGYTLNSMDRKKFVKFDRAIEKISLYEGNNQALMIEDKIEKYKFEIKFEKDPFSGERYKFSELN